MRVRPLAATLIATLPLAGCIGPADDGVHRRGAPAELTFDEFVDQAYREPFEGGVWIVDGDTPVGSLEELRAIYDRLGTRQRSYGGGDAPADGALTINTVGGADDRWPDDRKRDLSYCVSRSQFAGRYDEVVRTMADATAAWEAVADVGFRHASEEDGACDASNPRVIFDVRPVDTGGEYLARAFFPSDPRAQRNVLIDASSFEPLVGITLTGILRHELGHVLGFRHEHTRPESGTCFEDSAHRPLTPYDRASVMHYPQCNGEESSRLEITPLDANGAATVYGAPGAAPTPERPAEPAPLEPDVSDIPHASPFGSETPEDPPPGPEPTPPPGPEPPPSDCVTASGVLFPTEIHRYPPLDVPAGSTVTVRTSGVGDPDLYAWIEGSAGGCASESPGATESCSVAATGAPLMVEVYGFTAASYELTVCW